MFALFMTSVLGADWLRDHLTNALNWIRGVAGPVWDKLKELSTYVGKVVANAVSTLIQYLKPVINKIFSALDFVGSWARKLAGKLLDAFKTYGGCLYEEVECLLFFFVLFLHLDDPSAHHHRAVVCFSVSPSLSHTLHFSCHS